MIGRERTLVAVPGQHRAAEKAPAGDPEGKPAEPADTVTDVRVDFVRMNVKDRETSRSSKLQRAAGRP